MRPIKYCPDCGHLTENRIPDGDTRLRAVCQTCDTIHYQNPKIVGGTLPVWQDRILLCKRAIEPRYGTWTLPAGFMENGESVPECALRETWEEAEAEVSNLALFTVHSVPQFNQIYMLFRAELQAEDAFRPGVESLDVQLFREDEIPWEEISFRMITRTLECYFADRARGTFGLHVEDIVRAPTAPTPPD